MIQSLEWAVEQTIGYNRLVRPYELPIGRELPVEPPTDPPHNEAVQAFTRLFISHYAIQATVNHPMNGTMERLCIGDSLEIL